MKVIKYKFLSAEINRGTEEEPIIEQIFVGKTMTYSEENFAHAKEEAYNGEYEIYDDGKPAPEPAEQTMWDELDAAYQSGINSI